MLSAMITVQIHQIMKMKEEFEALKQQRDTRNAKEPEECSASLMAACPSTCLQVRDHHACMPAYCLNLATSLSIMTATHQALTCIDVLDTMQSRFKLVVHVTVLAAMVHLCTPYSL